MEAMRILLIDDNRDHANILQWVFRQTGRVDEFVYFGDGMSALDYLRRQGRTSRERPDLIFLDFNLPRLDGREVLRLLKAEDATKSIPVVVVSSSERDEDVRRAYELGASNYISKSEILEDVGPMLKSIDVFTRRDLRTTRGGGDRP